jgi:hypothetical protein
MATQVQFRRGTTVETSTFAGAIGEVTVDLTKHVCVVHDGSKAGGYPLMLEDGSNIALGLGSLSTCAIKFANDPNTGLYSPGADQLALVTNGTARLAIDATGTTTAYGFFNARAGSSALIGTLTDAATITPDFNAFSNFAVTLGGNRTLGNPTNMAAGASGVIVITQDGSGSRTLAYGSYWKFPGGTAPTLTTTANAVDVLCWYVESSTRITARLLNDVK